MLNVLTAYKGGGAPLNIHQYGDLIALDLLYQYVLEIITLTHESVLALEKVQVDKSDIERFLNQLRRARERIRERQQNAFQEMDAVLSMIEATQLIEKQLHVLLGGVANEYNGY
jgi:conjugative transfer pilus assembly protein TraH